MGIVFVEQPAWVGLLFWFLFGLLVGATLFFFMRWGLKMEKYGADVKANLVMEETRLMREMAEAMSSPEKRASLVAKLDLQISSVRTAISELASEEK